MDVQGYANVKNEEFLASIIKDFWQKYGDKTYEGLQPKLAIFASRVEEANNEVRPAVERILAELGVPLSKILVNVGDSAITSNDDIRNFQNLDECLKEMHRVLADNGHLAVVDLCTPVSFPMKQLFYLYKKVVMPTLGMLFSKDKTAYSYLPETMDAVPQAERMQGIIQQAGFQNVNYRRLAFGMCILYTATK